MFFGSAGGLRLALGPDGRNLALKPVAFGRNNRAIAELLLGHLEGLRARGRTVALGFYLGLERFELVLGVVALPQRRGLIGRPRRKLVAQRFELRLPVSPTRVQEFPHILGELGAKDVVTVIALDAAVDELGGDPQVRALAIGTLQAEITRHGRWIALIRESVDLLRVDHSASTRRQLRLAPRGSFLEYRLSIRLPTVLVQTHDCDSIRNDRPCASPTQEKSAPAGVFLGIKKRSGTPMPARAAPGPVCPSAQGPTRCIENVRQHAKKATAPRASRDFISYGVDGALAATAQAPQLRRVPALQHPQRARRAVSNARVRWD
jgi:hypothetical protein